MIGSTNRAARRSRALRRVTTSVLSAATAFGLAGAPHANAAIPLDIEIDPAYTAGTIASLLNFVGNAFPGTSVAGLFNSGPPQTIDYGLVFPYTVEFGSFGKIPLVLDIELSLVLNNLKQTGAQDLYNTIASIPQQYVATPEKYSGCGGTYGIDGFKTTSNPATACRFAFVLGTSGATRNLANAYRTEIESVTTGVTPAGYIPFEAVAGSTSAKPTQTLQALAFLQNPLRPNGGFLARFPGLSNLLGQDPSMPAAGLYKSPDGLVTLNTSTVDATWAYDPTGDFPAVFNVFSILNSLNAFLPVNLAGGLSATTPYVLADQGGGVAEISDVGLSLATLFQVPVTPTPASQYDPYWLVMEPGQAFYATIVPKQLPLLTPNRLPALAINAILGALNFPFRFGTPFADAIEPAMKILVNIGYDDVLTPDEVDTCAVDCKTADEKTWAQLGYQAYDRTFTKSGVSTPFGSVDPLTPEEKAAVPGDVFEALLAGFRAQLSKPLFGIIVPASASEPAPAAGSRVAAPAATEPSEGPVQVDVADIADPIPTLTSTPLVSPKRDSVRASRGKADGRPGTSVARKPTAATVASGGDVVKPAAAAGKRTAAR